MNHSMKTMNENNMNKNKHEQKHLGWRIARDCNDWSDVLNAINTNAALSQ